MRRSYDLHKIHRNFTSIDGSMKLKPWTIEALNSCRERNALRASKIASEKFISEQIEEMKTELDLKD